MVKKSPKKFGSGKSQNGLASQGKGWATLEKRLGVKLDETVGGS